MAHFVLGLEERLQAIEQAVLLKEWIGVESLSHKLAGAALFGFPEIGEAAHALEKAVRKGEHHEAPQHLLALKERCRAVMAK